MPASTVTEATILTLLVSDASESELRAALERLQGQATSKDEGDRIDHLARSALALHSARAEDRRRALGLTALSDTATDLAAHIDVDELLEAICRRARLLLGTDVAYVTLRDDAGDTYVHATDGIVSEAFRTMRLATGTGLGGLVAQTGQPETTADYARDGRLRHSSDVDRRVAAEGLRGIVAAPLKRGIDVFGVLMSGSREIRHFEPFEVALFASLASHAAIALQNARLIQNSRAAVADLARAHEALQRHAQRVEHIAQIHEQLAALAVNGAGVGSLLEAVVDRLPGEIELRSASGELLESRSHGEQQRDGDWIEAPVLSGAEALGRLRMRSANQSGVEDEVLQRTAVLVASMLLSRQASSEAQHRHRSMLLEELLTARAAPAGELRRRAERAGIASETEHVVLAIAPDPTGERWAWLHTTRFAQSRHAVVGTVGARIVVIEPGVDARMAATAWSDLLQACQAGAPTIGAASGAVGPAGVRTCHAEAVRALSVLLALGRAGTWATVSDLGIFGQMLGRPGEHELEQFLTRTLGVVRAYDARRGGDLEATLEGFLTESGHLANTARRLGIHINTLYQRLERLDEVLGTGWRDPDRRLELHLAVRLAALQRTLET